MEFHAIRIWNAVCYADDPASTQRISKPQKAFETAAMALEKVPAFKESRIIPPNRTEDGGEIASSILF